ncbi:MAG: Rho termination factor N-terminal domain-containing protein [bacterium]
MNINDIKTKAKEVGVKAGKMNKSDLIRAIQSAEGNFPCFETATDYCDQSNCAWMEDCLSNKNN